MRILLMGPQGCGKGTVGAMLSKELGIPMLSLGNLFRNLPDDFPRVKEITNYLNEGVLVPSDIVADVIKERIAWSDCSNGFIMDGWGRRMEDINNLEMNLDKVILINISEDTSIKRITGRRICDSDGKTYNIYTLPKEELEKCEGNLIQRDDDTMEALNERLHIYHTETQKVIEYFRKKGILAEVSGEVAPQEVLNQILEVLNP